MKRLMKKIEAGCASKLRGLLFPALKILVRSNLLFNHFIRKLKKTEILSFWSPLEIIRTQALRYCFKITIIMNKTNLQQDRWTQRPTWRGRERASRLRRPRYRSCLCLPVLQARALRTWLNYLWPRRSAPLFSRSAGFYRPRSASATHHHAARRRNSRCLELHIRTN